MDKTPEVGDIVKVKFIQKYDFKENKMMYYTYPDKIDAILKELALNEREVHYLFNNPFKIRKILNTVNKYNIMLEHTKTLFSYDGFEKFNNFLMSTGFSPDELTYCSSPFVKIKEVINGDKNSK